MRRDSIKLLRECETVGKTALDWIAKTEEEIEDDRLKQMLQSYRQKYCIFSDRVDREFSLHRRQSRELSPVNRAEVWMKLHTGLLMKHTDSEIADMLSTACFTQTKQLSHVLNHCPGAEQNTVALTKELILLQQKCTEELREFL